VGRILLGAGLALLGGIAVALFEGWRTERVAVRLRRAERQDEALLRTSALLSAVESTLSDIIQETEVMGEKWSEELESSASDTIHYGRLRDALEAFEIAWFAELSSVVRDDGIIRQCEALQSQWEAIVYWNEPPGVEKPGPAWPYVVDDVVRGVYYNVVEARAAIRRRLA
jgi:hypothetical protein